MKVWKMLPRGSFWLGQAVRAVAGVLLVQLPVLQSPGTACAQDISCRAAKGNQGTLHLGLQFSKCTVRITSIKYS